MILSNTLTSAAVQGTAVQAAADDNPVLGFGVVGNGRNWISTPGFANSAVLAAGTLGIGATLNIDWTQVGYATRSRPPVRT